MLYRWCFIASSILLFGCSSSNDISAQTCPSNVCYRVTFIEVWTATGAVTFGVVNDKLSYNPKNQGIKKGQVSGPLLKL